MLLWILAITALLGVAAFIILQRPVFGAAPSGLLRQSSSDGARRLERIKGSPNHRDGAFQNQHHTPPLTEGHSMASVLWEFLVSDRPRRMPVDTLPSEKHDLLHLPKDRDLLVWFGHSSYLLQVGGRTVLVDPVLSGRASPIPGVTTAFPGTDRYGVDDLPPIDLLLITHDHYDHLDHRAVKALRTKVKQVVCGLGVGAHLERWGYPADMISETDWHETLPVLDGMTLHTAPARHFSGRGLTRNNTLWQSYILDTGRRRIYIGGDSGHDTHFAEIGAAHGPFDLAILECGQYDIKWRYIHMLPEEVVPAAQELRAARLLAVHNAKFPLANHPWNEPLTKVSAYAGEAGLPLLTPLIGEVVDLDDSTRTFTKWWEGLR